MQEGIEGGDVEKHGEKLVRIDKIIWKIYESDRNCIVKYGRLKQIALQKNINRITLVLRLKMNYY